MRLHRLTVTGIGPYPGTETIDFDRFADSGRFLLTGPTGAGKTTIIDAIVFALYGVAAAAARDHILSRPRILAWMRRTFAAAFVALGAKLAFADR